jgi:hypothetical protein
MAKKKAAQRRRRLLQIRTNADHVKEPPSMRAKPRSGEYSRSDFPMSHPSAADGGHTDRARPDS